MGWKANAPSDFVWAGGVMAGIVCLQDAGAIVKRRAAVRAKDVPGPKLPVGPNRKVPRTGHSGRAQHATAAQV
jgi:hypothetical protein